jgi:hypothetical protein
VQHTSISVLACAGVALALGFAVAACGKVAGSDLGTSIAPPGTGDASSDGMGALRWKR